MAPRGCFPGRLAAAAAAQERKPEQRPMLVSEGLLH